MKIDTLTEGKGLVAKIVAIGLGPALLFGRRALTPGGDPLQHSTFLASDELERIAAEQKDDLIGFEFAVKLKAADGGLTQMNATSLSDELAGKNDDCFNGLRRTLQALGYPADDTSVVGFAANNIPGAQQLILDRITAILS